MLIASISPKLNDSIFGRFQYDTEKGTIKGDNRSHHTAVCFNIWTTSPLIGVGTRNLISIGQKTKEFVGANPLVFFAADGVIGQFILWLPILCLINLRKRCPQFMYAGIILFVGFMQRPYDPTQLMYPLVILSMYMEGYRYLYLEDVDERSDFEIRTNS